jgi:hypothetical protein
MSCIINVALPFRVKQSGFARANCIDIQTSVNTYNQVSDETYNLPIVENSVSLDGRPASFETVNSNNANLLTNGISAIDSTSGPLEVTLPDPENSGDNAVQKEIFLLYLRSSPVTINYNGYETLPLNASVSYYKLMYVNGFWSVLY